MRRKRSEMTEADCLDALRKFAPLIERMGVSSQEIFGTNPLPRGKISVQFQIAGCFGTAENLFEAVRVLAGHKLPAKTDKMEAD